MSRIRCIGNIKDSPYQCSGDPGRVRCSSRGLRSRVEQPFRTMYCMDPLRRNLIEA